MSAATYCPRHGQRPDGELRCSCGVGGAGAFTACGLLTVTVLDPPAPAAEPLADNLARHPSSVAFLDVLRDALAMHDRKQQDYGSDVDPFANVRSAQDFGLPPSLGAAIRINDKVARLKAYYRSGTLANEGAEDAYMDLLVYAGIGLVLLRQELAGSATETGDDASV